MKKQRSFLIPLPPVYSFKECLWFLNRNYDDCLHTFAGDSILKALDVEGEPVLIRISATAVHLSVEIWTDKERAPVQKTVTDYIKEWFDLERNLEPFYRLLHKEKKLAYMTVAYNGLRLVGIPDLFEALCWSIIGQQINLTFAYRLKRRLTERFGKRVLQDGLSHYLFPSSASLSKASLPELREMQYSQKKAEYITSLATVVDEGTISKTLLLELPSFAAQQGVLTALRGIGVWTANYTLMKSLRVAEAIPYGDAGLLQALMQHGLIKDRKDQAGIERLFRKFKGWESYLVFYLWRSLSEPEG